MFVRIRSNDRKGKLLTAVTRYSYEISMLCNCEGGLESNSIEGRSGDQNYSTLSVMIIGRKYHFCPNFCGQGSGDLVCCRFEGERGTRSLLIFGRSLWADPCCAPLEHVWLYPFQNRRLFEFLLHFVSQPRQLYN